jgi:hypothetical protein
MKRNEWVMAVDIEMSGAIRRRDDVGEIAMTLDKKNKMLLNSHYGDVIAIGAAVVSQAPELKLVGEFLMPMYRDYARFGASEASVFEKRTAEEFWSKNMDILEQIKVPEEQRKIPRKDYERYSITKFHEFRGEIENRAQIEGCWPLTVSDNVGYDISMLNEMTAELLPYTRPMVYRSSDNSKYNGGNPCVNSTYRGILAAVNGDWFDREREEGENKSTVDRVHWLYGVPPASEEDGFLHDHNPRRDAMVIARNYQIARGIASGVYTLKKERLSLKTPSTK